MTRCLWTTSLTRYAIVATYMAWSASPASGQIPWKNDLTAAQVGNAGTTNGGVRVPDARFGTSPGIPEGKQNVRGRHVLLRFDEPLHADLRSAARASGLTILQYVADHAYFARIATDADLAQFTAVVPMARIEPIQPHWKTHPLLSGNAAPVHAIVADAGQGELAIAAYIVLHKGADLDRTAARLSQTHGLQVRTKLSTVDGLVVELRFDRVGAVALEDEVQWIEPALPALSETLDDARVPTQVDEVHTLPSYGLDGSGVSVLIYDGSVASELHPDFAGRLTARDGTPSQSHATHVSGIVGGSGLASGGSWRGVAPAVTLESFGFEAAGGGVFLYTDPGDIESDYTEAFAALGTQVANNSIGTNVCTNGFDCSITGDYGVTSSLLDALVATPSGPPVRMVWAAGNERDCDRCLDESVHAVGGYRSLAPPASVKNPIVVGAVNSDDLSVAAFSSFGPSDDGRLKPDMVAPGCQLTDDYGVTSTTILSSYTTLCGTSMSAPMVTGAAALLLQEFGDRFPNLPAPSNATIKALLLHSALDLGAAGPDFQTGYGLLQMRDAIDLVRSGRFANAAVAQNELRTYGIEVAAGADALVLTLAWDDPPGVPNVLPALQNDLDLRVFDPSGAAYFPWTLDPQRPAFSAVRTHADRLNNVEQVFVDNPMAGTWRVEVFGWRVPASSQPFAICFSHALSVDCDGDGTPDLEQIAEAPEQDCGANGILDACESDCDDDGIVDTCAVFTGIARDCNRNGIPDDCASIIDCNGNGVHDPCDILDLVSSDCDANGIPDECDTDCNDNGTPDACELSGGSADCNNNGEFDLCEPWFDCNGNFVSDTCEVARGLVDDFNSNGIPDGCEPQGQVRHVNPAACDAPVAEGDTGEFCTIQAAINASISGDTVIVTPGTYNGPQNRNLDFGGRLITLRSVDPADPEVVASTIVDCEHKGRGLYFHSNESRAAIVDGLTVINGLASQGGTAGASRGGGMYIKDSAPTIRRCVIANCMTAPTIVSIFGGAAIYCERASPLVEDCDLSANVSFNFGGGLYAFDNSHPVLRHLSITDNLAFVGAGVATDLLSSLTLERCLVAWNATSTGGQGGALYVGGQGTIHATDSLFIQNESDVIAGGMWIAGSSIVDFNHVTIADNSTGQAGGGLWVDSVSTTSMAGSIVWGNRAAGSFDQIRIRGQSDVLVSYSDVQGGPASIQTGPGSFLRWLDGNIDANPQFESPMVGAYTLLPGSPCIDAGDPARAEDAGDLDRAGNIRVQFCRADMGALEAAAFADCNSNLVPDRCETDAGDAEDCDGDGRPDVCQDTSADCNSNGIWDVCEIVAGELPDCNGNRAPDDCDLSSGAAADCNENDIPDTCDIADGVSADVNGNGLPDECESCEEASECDDGIWCNGNEVCASGICLPGTPPCFLSVCVEATNECIECAVDTDCNDNNECTNEICDHATCIFTNRKGGCDDGQACTHLDRCEEGLCRGEIIPGCSVAVAIEAVSVDGVPVPGGPSQSIVMYAGQSVTCELRLAGWSPDQLRLYQVGVAPDGFTSGIRGSLFPLIEPDPSAGFFVEQNREDFIFFGVPTLVAVLSLDPNALALGAFTLFGDDCAVDAGNSAYLGTLVVQASADAGGAFVLCPDGRDTNFDLEPDNTFLRTCDGLPILPIEPQCLHVLVIADCNDNGIPDDEDIAAGTSEDCSMNGVPDECEPDCNGNGVADSCDIAAGTVLDCNENGVPDPCDIGSGHSGDCNANAIPDECEPDCNENGMADVCDIDGAFSVDCNGDSIPDECQDCNGNGIGDPCEVLDGLAPDCNSNLLPDECDIALGTSEDCNLDGIPDECQDTDTDCNENGIWDACESLASADNDCNVNGILDSCDIASGISRDCDANGLPDECLDLFPRVVETAELTEARGAVFVGVSDGDGAGDALAALGDVNNDGFDDFAIVATDAENVGDLSSGEVYVIYGRPSLWDTPFELSELLPGPAGQDIDGFLMVGIEGGDSLGQGIAGGGDVNGDGIDDMVIGAPGVNQDDDNLNAGAVYVVYGRSFLGTSGMIDLTALDGTNGFTILGVAPGDNTGADVAIIDDINGDDLDDIIISAHTAAVGDQTFAGRTSVIFGSTRDRPPILPLVDVTPEGGGDGSLGFVVSGVAPSDLSGFSVSGAGDVNGDGFGDLLLGAFPAAAHGNPFTGEAYLIFGGAAVGLGGEIRLSELAAPIGVTIRGIDPVDIAGHQVAAAGDVNDDGLGDFLVGAPWADPGGRLQAGETYLIFGRGEPWPSVLELSSLLPANGGDGSRGVIINGTSGQGLSGFAIAGVGDVNADSLDDIMIGAYVVSAQGVDRSGAAYVVFGNTDAWPPSLDLSTLLDAEVPPDQRRGFFIAGASAGDALGFRVASAGDVNGDGVGDMLVAATNADREDEENVGHGYLLFGRAPQPPDCNLNGMHDLCDIEDEVSTDCDLNQTPDECQEGIVDCNGNGIWDLCDVRFGQSPDCNANGVPDKCDVASGFSEDCNQNIVPDECEENAESDCNGNDIWDVCDIFAGTSGDCNENSIPDECESGIDQDCNGNLQRDICDIFQGVSEDRNRNDVPDECEPLVTIFVDVVRCDASTGGSGSAPDPYCTIQDAVSAAGDGSDAVVEIVLADGVYTGTGNHDIDFAAGLAEGATRAVTLRSANGPFHTVVDVANALHFATLTNGETGATRIEGLSIIGARRSAIECLNGSSPLIRNCIINRNFGFDGAAGIRCVGSSPTIERCIIAGNFVRGIGGAAGSRPVIRDTLIAGNHGGEGGAMIFVAASHARIDSCTIANNLGQFGGGAILSSNSLPVITNSILHGNAINEVAGPVLIRWSLVADGHPGAGNIEANPRFRREDFGNWTNMAMYDEISHRTTVIDESAQWEAGALIGSLVNLNLENDLQMEFVVVDNSASSLSFWGTDVELVEVGAPYRITDYRLDIESPCVNAGDFEVQNVGMREDVLGAERVQYCRLDMGAYESSFAVDCDANRLIDACEALAEALVDCNSNAVPDSCDPDCNENAIPDQCDIAAGVAEDTNQNGVPDECDVRLCDVDGDGAVRVADRVFMNECVDGIRPVGECQHVDFNEDGLINSKDLLIFGGCFLGAQDDDGNGNARRPKGGPGRTLRSR